MILLTFSWVWAWCILGHWEKAANFGRQREQYGEASSWREVGKQEGTGWRGSGGASNSVLTAVPSLCQLLVSRDVLSVPCPVLGTKGPDGGDRSDGLLSAVLSSFPPPASDPDLGTCSSCSADTWRGPGPTVRRWGSIYWTCDLEMGRMIVPPSKGGCDE